MLVAYFQIIIGLLATSFGMKKLLHFRSLMNKGKVSIGKVSGFHEKTEQGHRRYYPVISFHTQEHQLINSELHMGAKVPMFLKGEKLRIIYEEDNPKHIELFDFTYILSLFIILLGIVVIVLGGSKLV
ncbi:DUF3592 domain-containing protein [Rapidithrix thailandica]|uniref:DUF3592 domain-containing protein n=1 Tax=Rapidithrix thailandica TaxID=413964 RepID=A0AAW9SIE1_9BACT